MNKRNLILIIMMSTLIAVGVRVGAKLKYGNEDSTIALRPDDVSMVSQGRKIYTDQCAACHGKNLEGQPDWQTPLANGRYPAPPHDIDGHTWHHVDELLFQLTKSGPAAVIGNGHKSDMPGFKGTLSDREILAVLSFIKSTWPRDVRQNHDLLNKEARARQGKKS